MIARAACVALVALSACGAPQYVPPPSLSEASVYTADGHVLGVERRTADDPAVYVHLVLQSNADSPVQVELGPGWYLDKNGMRFSKDDPIYVEGWHSARAGQPVIVAKRVRSGSTTLELRDDQSRPLWEK